MPVVGRWLRRMAGSITILGVATAPAVATPASGSTLPFPSGRVTYLATSAVGKESLTVFWAENGRRYKALRTGTLGVTIAWYLSDGTHYYYHQARMGDRARRVKLRPASRGAGAIPVLPRLVKSRVVGKGKLLNRPCEIREGEGQRLWTWKGLPLKQEVREGGQWTTLLEARSVEAVPRHHASVFRVPSGFSVSDLPAAGSKAAKKPAASRK